MATILHIEDDPRNRLLVRKLLNAAGHEVVEAETGMEAVQRAATCHPHLVLVDINIPGLDGYEVILRLRSMAALQSVPIVAVTAEGERQTSLAVGADGFLSKPIDAARFAGVVAKYLGGYREESGTHAQARLRERSQVIVGRLEEKLHALESANARLEEFARLRREFLRNTTHELATPLTPLLGYLQLLLAEDLGPVSEIQRKSLKAMEKSLQRLRGVVDTLLDFSALESGRMRLIPHVYDLVSVVRSAVKSMQTCAGDRAPMFALRFPDGPRMMEGDAEKVKRAVAYLLDNAEKFSKTMATAQQGGLPLIGVEVRDEVTTTATPGVASPSETPWPPGIQNVSLLVADNGCGIPAREQSRIFEPFYQSDGSPTRDFGGVGLGLAFVQKVVALSGGTVDVESPPRREVAGRSFSGAVFQITLPIAHAKPLKMSR